jgi:hypothetical protein
MYYFYVYNLFAIWISLFIVPQIVHNAMRGNNPKFYNWYVWGMLASRVLLPVSALKIIILFIFLKIILKSYQDILTRLPLQYTWICAFHVVLRFICWHCCLPNSFSIPTIQIQTSLFRTSLLHSRQP